MQLKKTPPLAPTAVPRPPLPPVEKALQDAAARTAHEALRSRVEAQEAFALRARWAMGR